MRIDTPQYLQGLIHELLQLPSEEEWVEFKCNNGDPREIGQYISAISNSAALLDKANGYIIWGIDDLTHNIKGTTFHPTTHKKGNEELENWLIRLLSPRIHFRFFEFEYEGKQVSLIEIPRATHQPVQFENIEYIRIGSYKKKLKDFPEKERELWRIFDITPFEEQVALESLDSGDVLQLLEYPSYFRLLNQPLPDTRAGITERLAEDRMIAASPDGKWNILNLGAILFAADLSAFKHLTRKTVRVVEYDGDGRIFSKREHQEFLGYAAGFEKLIGSLKTLLPENEVIVEAFRKSVPMYPEIAIRELVANVIIHQDFTVTGAGPLIEIFDGRLEVTNPGEPLMDTNRFLDTPPRSRNEALASFLRRVNICEERGSGIDKIVHETEFYQLPAPLFEVVSGQTRATLFAHKSFSEMNKTDRIRACYLHACLQYVQRKQMTNSSLRDRFGIEKKNSAQVTRVINDTTKEDLIKLSNPDNESRRHTSYVPFWA